MGDTVQMSVTASNAGTYQWYRSPDNGETWNVITATNTKYRGADTSVLTIDVTKTTTSYVYRCVVRNGDVTVASAAAGITVAVEESLATLTYSAGGGVFADGQTAHSEQVSKGTYYINHEEPTRDGYRFLGWSYNGNFVDKIKVNGSVTLTAEWEKVYTVVYSANGGAFGDGTDIHTEITSDSVFYFNGEEPVRDGYEFLGWALDGRIVRKAVLTGDVELQAQWERIIAVTYEANGGRWQFDNEPAFTTRVEYEPAGVFYPGWIEPQRDGYEFDGWTVNGQYIRKMNLTEPITVQAQWRKELTVTYDPNGGAWGDDTAPRTQYVRDGEYNVGEQWPEREGYSFLGWSTDRNALTGAMDFTVELQESITFYAVWGEQPIVTYDGNGGGWGWNGSGYDETAYEREADPGQYNLGSWSPEREGYDFRGWVDAQGESAENRAIILNQDYTFYASWAKHVTVTYDGNGGGWDWDGQSYGETVRDEFATAGEFCLSGWEPQREGYVFLGWTADENGKDDSANAVLAEDPVILSDDLTVYAVWGEMPVITYDANGGWFEDGDSMHDVTVEPGVCHVGHEWPSGEAGMSFLGWSADPDAVDADSDFETTVTGNVTYYAIWEQMLSLTYDANGGVFPNGGTTRTDYWHYMQAAYVDWWSEEPVRSGYVFDGWTVNGEAAAGRIRMTEDLVALAQWTRTPEITFDANGGVFADGETTQTRSSLEGSLYSFSSQEIPTRSGYEFDGWTVNGEYASMVRLTDDVTVTAAWTQAESGYYTVTYDANGGSFGDDELTTYSCEIVRGASLASIDGVNWAHSLYNEQAVEDWYLNPECTGDPVDDDYIPTEDIVLYAKWVDAANIRLFANGGYFDFDGVIRDYIRFVGAVGNEFTYEEFTSCLVQNDRELLGWYYEPECVNLAAAPGEAFVPTERETDLYAKWSEANGCTITFDGNGGGIMFSPYAQMSFFIVEGQPIDLYPEGEWTGEGTKLFTGWLSDPNDANSYVNVWEYVPTQDMTLYASWVDGYTVTFNGNGGIFCEDESWTEDYITVMAGNAGYTGQYSTFFTNGNLTVEGWYLDAECTQWAAGRDDSYTPTADVTLYAKWVEGYTVTFDGNGGMIYLEQAGAGRQTFTVYVPHGEPVNYCPMTVANEDWTMSGNTWYLDAECTGDAVDTYTYVPTGDVTFYAKLVSQVAVTFNANGGYFYNEYSDDTYTEEEHMFASGETISVGSYAYPLPASGSGLLLAGWYLNAECTGEAVETLTVTEDVTLYAKWVESVSVLLYANGGYYDFYGNIVDYVRQRAPQGTVLSESDFPRWLLYSDTHNSRTFLGWYYEPECVNLAIEPDGEFTPSQDETRLYAKWSEAEGYTVTFDANGGEIGGRYYPLSFFVPSDETVNLSPNVVWAGEGDCTFTGWYLDLDDLNTYVDPYGYCMTEDITLYARWEGFHTATFDANGGFFAGDPQQTTASEQFYEGNWIDTSWHDISVENGDLAVEGWYLDAECTQLAASRMSSYEPGDRDVTLYAKWVPGYAVTFDGNGGGLYNIDDQTTATIHVPVGQQLQHQPYVGGDGTVCTGWYLNPECTGDQVYPWEYVPTGDVTLYALLKNAVEVTFEANGGSFWGDDGAQYYTLGEGEILGMEPEPTPADYSLVFTGWNTASDGSGAAYDPWHDSVSGDITVYAVYGPTPTASLGENTATFSGNRAPYFVFTPTESGIYVFESTDENGNDPYVDVEYEDGENGTVAFFDDDSGEGMNFRVSCELTAGVPCRIGIHGGGRPITDAIPFTVQKVDAVYTVTLDANGGYFWGVEDQTALDRRVPAGYALNLNWDFNGQYSALSHSDVHKAFGGWYSNPEGTGEAIDPVTYVPGGNVTLYAKWLDGYIVTFDGNGGYLYNNQGPTSVSFCVPYGQAVQEFPYAVTADGSMTDNGWYLNSDCTGEPVYDYVPTGDVTLYANLVISHTVTLNANGGYFANGNETMISVIPEGRWLVLGANGAYRSDTDTLMVVQGWYYDAECTQLAGVLYGRVQVNGDMTLYAKWSEGCHVSFYGNGGCLYGEADCTDELLTWPVGVVLGDAAPYMEDTSDSSFAGWYLNAECTGDSVDVSAYAPTGDVGFYAKWESGDNNTVTEPVSGDTGGSMTVSIPESGLEGINCDMPEMSQSFNLYASVENAPTGETLVYQWQESYDGVNDWQDIINDSADPAQITITKNGPGTYYFRLVVTTQDGGEYISNVCAYTLEEAHWGDPSQEEPMGTMSLSLGAPAALTGIDEPEEDDGQSQTETNGEEPADGGQEEAEQPDEQPADAADSETQPQENTEPAAVEPSDETPEETNEASAG